MARRWSGRRLPREEVLKILDNDDIDEAIVEEAKIEIRYVVMNDDFMLQTFC